MRHVAQALLEVPCRHPRFGLGFTTPYGSIIIFFLLFDLVDGFLSSKKLGIRQLTGVRLSSLTLHFVFAAM
jgi:hypothetical protein